jgi:gliding motility-associated-like protein|tara:strand:- start:155 stop:700 length:546 start_codon:yes stop_codon:yes gene_type:complete
MSSSEGSLKAGEIATYEASYTIEEATSDTGKVENVVIATASSPGNTEDVSDVSDDGDDEDGNIFDDPTVTKITYVKQGIEIFNLVTPNGDNMNDFFKIKGIESFPENSIKIFNRWGVLVFESDDYGNTSSSDNVFKGFSKGRITIQKNKRLPTGTYYYIIYVSNEKTKTKKYSGYLFLTNY